MQLWSVNEELARDLPGTLRRLGRLGYGTDFATGIVGQDDVIDWPAVFAAARGAVKHAYVEQEPPHRVPVSTALARCRDAWKRMA